MRRNSVFLGIMCTRPSVGAGMHPDPVHLSDGVRADTGRGEREGPSGPDLRRSPSRCRRSDDAPGLRASSSEDHDLSER